MTRFEILVEVDGVKYTLDTYKTEPISLNYNIADIQDISKRNTSYSKTITLPETKKNRNIFSDISNLDADNNFNPNLKTKCWILLDTLVVFEGNLQLTKVVDDRLNNFINYEVVIFAETDNFYKQIGDQYLSDMDLSSYNHYYSVSGITSSWENEWSDGYFYPLIDYGSDWSLNDINGSNGDVSLYDMKPSLNVKVLWDKIFSDAGYTYESNFLNSDRFKELWVPFNNKGLKTDENVIENNRFKATQTGTVSRVIPAANYFTYYAIGGNPFWTNASSDLHATFSFNDDTTSPNFDPSGLYSTTLFEYENTTGDYFKGRFRITGSIYETNGWIRTSPNGQLNIPLQIQVLRSLNRDGTPNATWNQGLGARFPTYNGSSGFVLDVNYAGQYPFSYVGTTASGTASGITYSFDFTTDWLDDRPPLGNVTHWTPLRPGEKVRVIVLNKIWRYLYALTAIGTIQKLITPGTPIFTINPSTFSLEVGEDAVEGSLVNLSSAIPEKIKKKDFISSIVKMFNLYIDVSKENSKKLIIEPREDYYAAGARKDWSDKLDISKPIDIKILAETQNKTTLLKYKDDSDWFNTDYKTKTGGDNYGLYRYELENDFVSGTKVIETIFSPTPVVAVPGSTQLIIPKIVKVNASNVIESNFTHNIRILQRNINKTLPVFLSTDNWKFEGVTYSRWPYLGHYDEIQNPSFDINFGQTVGLYYAQDVTTDDNLFETYYAVMFDELNGNDSRLVVADFYLTSQDIADFKFSDIIFINNQYYKVNKINGFDPTVDKTTRVELLKSKSYIRRNNRVRTSRGTGVIIFDNGPLNPARYADNKINSNLTIATGRFNTVNGDRVSINGSDNVINSFRTTVVGNENYTSPSSTEVTIFGSNNEVADGVSNVRIDGDNIVARESNTSYSSLTTIKYVNYINAGRDEVLNPFSSVKAENIINAGRNTVRPLGSTDLTNKIDGLVDDII